MDDIPSLLDEELTITLCEILGALPTFAYRPEEDAPPYTEAEVGVFYGAIGEAPHQAIGVRVYDGTDDALHTRRVQFHTRGKPRQPNGADRLASVLFAVLQYRIRGRGMVSITRISFAPLGADSNGREERTDNYIITLDNLEASAS
ncbi:MULTISPECIES: minor capsid protein [unclassified Microbacterium]|uniref:phage tail terminator protein n=1 Tax=unclassified Microbacterium TaxID=2609290 RepID=UPI003650C773